MKIAPRDSKKCPLDRDVHFTGVRLKNGVRSTWTSESFRFREVSILWDVRLKEVLLYQSDSIYFDGKCIFNY